MRAFVIVLVAAGVLATGTGCNTDVKPEPTDPPVASTTLAAGTISGEGVTLVGPSKGQMAPGRYQTNGPAADSGGNCYWARLKDTTGELDAILANSDIGGSTVVTIKTTDKAFESSGCQPWKKIN